MKIGRQLGVGRVKAVSPLAGSGGEVRRCRCLEVPRQQGLDIGECGGLRQLREDMAEVREWLAPVRLTCFDQAKEPCRSRGASAARPTRPLCLAACALA